MITKYKFNEKVTILFYEDSTKVTNSYLLTDKEIEQVANYIAYCRSCLYDWKCICLRDEKSYIREIKAHNKLYKMGLFISHTIDTDLEENITPLNKLAWFILGR